MVLTKEEVARVLRAADERYRLFLELLYGTGVRLLEGLRLRLKDVDFAASSVTSTLAASGTWTGSGADNNFSTAGNWSASPAPTNAADIATFDGTGNNTKAASILVPESTSGSGYGGGTGSFMALTAGQTQPVSISAASTYSTANAAWRLGAGTIISMDSGSGALTIDGFSAAVPLRFTLGSGSSATSHTIQNNNASGGSKFTLGANAFFSGGGGRPRTLIFDGTGDFVINGHIISSAGPGNLQNIPVIKNGSGILTLNGDNTTTNASIFGGISGFFPMRGLTLNAGTVNINNAGALGGNGGSFTITGGTFDNTSASAITISNIPVAWNGDFIFTGTKPLNLNTGAVSMSASRQVTVSANTLTVGGIVSGSGFSLTKVGNGTLVLTNVNTYSGGTIINAGTLALTGSGTAGTNNITLGGGTLDVSGVGGITLASGQSLYGSGVVTGAVTTASSASSKIYAGADGAAGTLNFSNSLTVSASSTFNLDVSASYSSGNDKVIVAGALNLNSTTFNIYALSQDGSPLDTTGDYVLVTAGSISGSPNSTVTWVGTPPSNSGSFIIAKSGNTIVLRYSVVTGPTISSIAASPTDVARLGKTLITAAITPGSGAISSVNVSGSALATSPVSLISDGAGNYTNTVTVAGGAALGSQILTVAALDVNALTDSKNTTINVIASAQVWNGNGSDNNWSTGGNWVSGIQPFNGDSITFAGTHSLTANMNSSFSIAALTFDNTAGSFDITNLANTLTLTGGVTNSSANAQAVEVPVVLSGSQNIETVGNVTFSQAISGSTGGLTKTGNGTLTLSGTNTYTGGTLVSQGKLNVTGSIIPASGTTSSLGVVGGAVYQSNGNFSVTNSSSGRAVVIGGNLAVATGDYGYYNLSGGSLVAGSSANINQIEVGGNGSQTSGTIIGVMDVTGGTATSGGSLQVARGASAFGLLNVNGGAVSVGTALQFAANSGVGVSVVNIGGGLSAASVTVKGTAGGANSAVDMANQSSGGTAILNLLTNGALTASQITNAFGSSANFLNFNGGRLKAVSANTANANFLTDTKLYNVLVFGNGGTIDNNAQNITVGLPLVKATGYGISSITLSANGSGYIGAPFVSISGGTGSGASAYAQINPANGQVTNIVVTSPGIGYTSGDVVTVTLAGGVGSGATANNAVLTDNTLANGGMTFVGTGTTRVDGVSTYTGPTIISAGTLGGIGTLAGALTNNASLSPGDSGIGTMTVNGNITLNTTSTNIFEVDGLAPANDQIVAGASVAYGGVLKVVATNVTVGQTFTLFSGSGAVNASNFSSVQSTDPAIAFSFTNGVLTAIPSINANPPQLQTSVSGSSMTLAWPTNAGWILQSNSVGLTATGSWFNYPANGAVDVTNITVTINPAKTNVFFRMLKP